MIEYVAAAGTCAAPAPASARCRVHRASTSGSPRFTTEHAPTNACATPDTLIEYVASAGTCAAPAPVSEAECDEDAHQRVLLGLWRLCTPTWPPWVEARWPPLNLGRRRRTERTASLTHHTRQNWTLSLMPWSSWQGDMGVIGCLCARFRRRPPCSCGDWRNSLKSGSAWASSAGMTCDAMWHSARRLRMLSKTSIDARQI